MPAANQIREARSDDADAIARIYNHYIAHTVVTFEEALVSTEELTQRIEKVQTASLPWLVVEQERDVVGYAYAGPWHARCAYRFSAEVTVYLAPDHVGRGLGALLYGALLPMLRARGFHSVIAGIALPNPASIALHEKFGLHKAAHYEEVGYKFNRWIDVGYWQKVWR
jgi:L-amino acid N-acyltransferase YncA